MTLLDAKKDFLYTVLDITKGELLHRRLLDMGFTLGTELYIAGVAPFGGTILVRIRGILIALREDAASLVNIAPVAYSSVKNPAACAVPVRGEKCR